MYTESYTKCVVNKTNGLVDIALFFLITNKFLFGSVQKNFFIYYVIQSLNLLHLCRDVFYHTAHLH